MCDSPMVPGAVLNPILDGLGGKLGISCLPTVEQGLSFAAFKVSNFKRSFIFEKVRDGS